MLKLINYSTDISKSLIVASQNTLAGSSANIGQSRMRPGAMTKKPRLGKCYFQTDFIVARSRSSLNRLWEYPSNSEMVPSDPSLWTPVSTLQGESPDTGNPTHRSKNRSRDENNWGSKDRKVNIHVFIYHLYLFVLS